MTSSKNSTSLATTTKISGLVEGGARLIARWQVDPALWCRHVLGCELTAQQAEVADALVENQRVAVRSGNGLGKTYLAASLALWWLSTGKGIVITTAPTWHHVQSILWQEMARLFNGSVVPLGGEFLPKSCRWNLGDQWQAFGRSTDNPSAFHGAHHDRVLVIFDEAQAIPSQIYDAAEGMMTATNSRFLIIGNPLEARGAFYKAFGRPDAWQGLTLSAMGHPNLLDGKEIIKGAVSAEWVEERKREWGERDPRYMARVLGEFPDTAGDSIVPLAWLESADKAKGGDTDEGFHFGVDVARYGADESVIAVLENNRLIEEIRLSGLDGNQLAGHVIKVAKQRGITQDEGRERIHIDPIGVGASLLDALKAEHWRVDAVNFAEKARGNYGDLVGKDMGFANLRAECYWVARESIRQNTASVPSKFGSTWEELAEGGYSYDRKGRLLIESKDKIKRRLGRSPDGADAFTLALARRAGTAPRIFLS